MAGLWGLAFLVQAICVGPDGGALAAPPWERECRQTRLQTVEDVSPFRRHDRANKGAGSLHPFGYQASDSILATVEGEPLAVQSFDFGDPPRRFGRFDGGRGDGGQVAAHIEGGYYAIFTEDGGAGRQWFVGPECARADGMERFRGWLLFGDDIGAGRWVERVAHLNIVDAPDRCASSYSPSLTRYRLDAGRVELSIGSGDGPVSPFDTRLIVSEHFGRETVQASDHLERFFFAQGLGLFRWERWESLDRSLFADAGERGRDFARTARCAPRPFSDPPEARWTMIDCREWLTVVEESGAASAQYLKDWPGAGLIPAR